MSHPETITIDQVEYVRKDSIQQRDKLNDEGYVRTDSIQQRDKLNDEGYVIVRSNGSGVHMGLLIDFDTKTGVAKLANARRIYYWKGAATLSQLAVDGTSCPEECKFPVSVEKITIANVLEVIPVTQKAKLSIDGVKIWKA